MTAVNKEVCKNLMRKGKFDTVMCELCSCDPKKCEMRKQYNAEKDETEYAETTAKFDETREMVKEGVING